MEATPKQIQETRDKYQTDEIQIDEDATVIQIGDDAWVSAWLWLPNEEKS